MAKSIRETIIDAFITRAATIVTTGGYNCNMGANVQWAIKTVDPDDLPAVVIWPQAETAEREYGDNVCSMTIRIEAIDAIGATSTGQAVEQMLADMIKAFDGGAALSSYVEDCKYVRGGADDYPDDGALAVAAFVEFEIKYRTAAGNPYST